MPTIPGSGRWLALTPLALLLGTGAAAAGDGSLGAVSRGSVTITASVAARASMAGAADVSLAGPAARLEPLCVASNARLNGFQVAATGSGPGGAFELSNGSDTIRYSVSLPAVPQPCGSGLGPGTFEIALDPDDRELRSGEGAYAGALTLILAPE